MTVNLLTEHHLEFLSLKRGCIGLSESTLIKMPHCWKSHVAAQIMNIVYVTIQCSPFITHLVLTWIWTKHSCVVAQTRALVCENLMQNICPLPKAVIYLQFWAYGSWDSLFPISMSQTATYESRTLFLTTSLKYYCILGLAEIKNLHPGDKIMRKRCRMHR